MENTKKPYLLKKGRPNDILSDSITRIKNGYSRRFDQIYLSHSKETLQLVEALLQGGYIQNYTCSGTPFSKACNKGEEPTLSVSLKYSQSLPAIRGIQRLSKPNKRLYFSKKKIIQVSQEQNWGENWTLFLSTSKGIIDHRQALDSEGTGGEGLCLVW